MTKITLPALLATVMFLGASVLFLGVGAPVSAQVLFSEDFEGGTNGQSLQDYPYSWTGESPAGSSNISVSTGSPIGNGMGVDGTWHPVGALGIYTKPIAAPTGDGFRLSGDLYAGTYTADNSFGVGNKDMSASGYADNRSGAFLHAVSGRWEFNARGVGAPNIMRFANNPRNQVVRGVIEIDLSTLTIMGSLTDASGVTETLTTPLTQWKNPDELGAELTPNVISIVERGNPSVSVDNIVLEKLVLDLEWNKNASSSWHSAFNWTPLNDLTATPVAPNTKTSIARFASAISSPQTVSVTSPVTVRRLDFESPHTYTIAGPSSVELEARAHTNARIDVNEGAHELDAAVNLASSTIANVAAGSSLTFDNTLKLNNKFMTKLGNGTMVVNGTLPRASSPVGGGIVVNRGTLGGNGTVDGYLTNIGSTVNPGSGSPGALKVSGHYSQGSTGRDLPIYTPKLQIDINGLTPGAQHDVLDVTGNLDILDGSLEISMGFTPSPGDTFDIFNFASARGAFDVITGSPGANLRWDTSQLFVDGTISVVETGPTEVFIEHVGSTNPISEGWSDSNTNPGGSAGGGMPANWQMVDTASSGFYRVTGNTHPDPDGLPAAFDDPAGWTATVTAKLNTADRGNESVIHIKDGHNTFEIQLFDGDDFGSEGAGAYYSQAALPNYAFPRLGTVDPRSGFHTYQIVLDAAGNTDHTDDMISLYVDGVREVGPLARSAFETGSGEWEFIIGRLANADGSGLTLETRSDTQHSLWRLETGQNVLSSLSSTVPEPASATLLIAMLFALALVRRRVNTSHTHKGQTTLTDRHRWQPRKTVPVGVAGYRWTFTLPALVFLIATSSAPAQVLDRGHRVLVERGLQLQALAHPVQNGFDLDRWNQSNFTTIDLHYHPYPTFGELPAGLEGVPWGRSMHHQEFYLDHDLFDHEMPHVSDMIRYQIRDEQDLTDPDEITYTAEIFSFLHEKYPNILLNTDVGMSVIEMRNFMQQAKPDLIMNQSYPFSNAMGNVGGSPWLLYENLSLFREAGLAGNDGTGTRPIPNGVFTQKFVRSGHTVSDSEARLQDFAAWAFGFKVVDSFFYDSVPGGGLQAVMFSGVGTDNPTSLFYQVAETNRQSLNLGPALVRLLSTDVRLQMGRHPGGLTNPVPEGVVTWNADADPYITDITATNLGSKNGGYEGDVVIGYYEPLHPAFTNSGFEDDMYFMVLNGLSDSDSSGTVAATSQKIRLDFDFSGASIFNLQRLSRNTGLVETVNLIHDGGSRYHLDLILEGGTGDLFKLNNGGTFVSGDLPTIGPGDYNADGTVDAADYTLWRDGLGTKYTQADYAVWKANFGIATSGSGSGTAVPEPTAVALLLGTTLVVMFARVGRVQKSRHRGVS